MKSLLAASIAMLLCFSNISIVYAQTSLETLMEQYVGTRWVDKNGNSKYYYGTQCKGFANYVFYKLWGVVHIGAYENSQKYYIPNPSGAYEVGRLNFSAMSLETSKNLLSKGLPGDFIQVRRRNKTYGHSMILVSTDSNGIIVFDCNSDGRCGIRKYHVSWQQFYNRNSAMSLYRANNNYGTVNNDSTDHGTGSNMNDSAVPIGKLDEVEGGNGRVRVYGWAFDADDYNRALDIHVYIGTASGPQYAIGNIKADKGRPDVGRVYPAAGGVHGFNDWIDVNETGLKYVYVYAINIGNQAENTCLGYQAVNISPKEIPKPVVVQDTTKPVIQNIKVTNVTSRSYTVSCYVTDDTAVDRVQFPTWTMKNGQDDIQKNWKTSYKASGEKSGSTYTYHVSISDHNQETGIYCTQIYAFDKSGNYSQAFVPNTTINAKKIYFGDLNKDGKISATDLHTMHKVILGQTILSEESRKRADLDGDGRITSRDEKLLQEYITEQIEFFPVEIYYGDVNKDGVIDGDDASTVQRAVVGKQKLSPDESKRADVNGDGKVNSKDVSLILQYDAGMISKFPVEK